jgi:hypothetical protein
MKVTYEVVLSEGTTEVISKELAREIRRMNRRNRNLRMALVAVAAVVAYKKITNKFDSEV